MSDILEKNSERFLEALKVSLRGGSVRWEDELQPQVWQDLFQTAQKHHVLPMIYEAVYQCPAAMKADPGLFMMYKQSTIQSVMVQTMKTGEFLRLYRHLESRGIAPLVVKGIVCRSLYPRPDYRASGDEDVQVDSDEYLACHEALLEYGMEVAEPEIDIQTAHEVPYGKRGSALYIELHKQLFPPDSDAYGDLNRYFVRMRERAVRIRLEGTEILTMGYTDHLFYLICHAFKHFLHSGFGLRQVCDILLFAETYGSEIDWQEVLEHCREIHADRFTAAMFRIGMEVLGFDEEKACLPTDWWQTEVDAGPMLLDLLDAGVFGDGSMSRKHSSTMTLNAVAAQRKGGASGKKAGPSVIKSVFPTAKDLSGRYPYLKEKPYLLPAAWVQRILKYRKELNAGGENSAAESIRIGEQRVQLFEYYGILGDSDQNARSDKDGLSKDRVKKSRSPRSKNGGADQKK